MMARCFTELPHGVRDGMRPTRPARFSTVSRLPLLNAGPAVPGAQTAPKAPAKKPTAPDDQLTKAIDLLKAKAA